MRRGSADACQGNIRIAKGETTPQVVDILSQKTERGESKVSRQTEGEEDGFNPEIRGAGVQAVLSHTRGADTEQKLPRTRRQARSLQHGAQLSC